MACTSFKGYYSKEPYFGMFKMFWHNNTEGQANGSTKKKPRQGSDFNVEKDIPAKVGKLGASHVT